MDKILHGPSYIIAPYIPQKVSPKKLETGKRATSAGIPYALLSGIEATGFRTVGLLLVL